MEHINYSLHYFRNGEIFYHEKCNPFKIQLFECCKCKQKMNYYNYILLECLHIIHLECIEEYLKMEKAFQESDRSFCEICKKNVPIQKYIGKRHLNIDKHVLINLFINYLKESKLNKKEFEESKIEIGNLPNNDKISIKVLLTIKENFEIFELYYKFVEGSKILNIHLEEIKNSSNFCEKCIKMQNEIELFIIDELILKLLCRKCIIT